MSFSKLEKKSRDSGSVPAFKKIKYPIALYSEVHFCGIVSTSVTAIVFTLVV